MRRHQNLPFACSLPLLATLLVVSAQLPVCSAKGQEIPDSNVAGSQPDPRTLLRETTAFLGQKAQYECKITSVIEIVASGMNNRIESITEFRVDRPDRFAMVLKSGLSGVSMVSDGKKLITHVPALQRYSERDAFENIDRAFLDDSSQGFAMAGLSAGFTPIGGDGHYKTLMDGVNDATYVGEEKIDGVACHHCRFKQDDVTWEFWREQGDTPLPRKIALDMSEQMAGNPMLKDAQMTFQIRYDDWDLNPKFVDRDFTLELPSDAEKVDDLFADMFGGGASDAPHPLLGEQAPKFKTNNLQEESIDLDDHLGKRVVIMDFWATWCGPCVEALPKIANVAKEFQNRNVEFFAVNVGEDSTEINEFLESKGLDINVLLDPDGEISEAYLAEAIPQTVIVGLDGAVQVVHVGLSGGLEEQLTGELNRLLNGENLAKETLEDFKQADHPAAEDFGATLTWSHSGRWCGVATEKASDQVFAISGTGKLVVLDATGAASAAHDIGQGNKIRLANLVGGGDPELLCFGVWGESVRAFDTAGNELWDYTMGQGVDDVWAGDLNGDGADEVIVGYNGGTGLHVLDQRGMPLWKYTDIGNVWHVASGDFDRDGDVDVVTTSALGKVHVFSADGSKKQDFDLPIYGTMVRTIPSDNESTGRILVTGTGDDGETLVALSASGETKFELRLPTRGTDHIDEMIVSNSRPWAAIGMRGGLVHVVDVPSATIIATVSGQGRQSDVAWLDRDGQTPLLLTASGRAVNAFEIVGTSVDESAEKVNGE